MAGAGRSNKKQEAADQPQPPVSQHINQHLYPTLSSMPAEYERQKKQLSLNMKRLLSNALVFGAVLLFFFHSDWNFVSQYTNTRASEVGKLLSYPTDASSFLSPYKILNNRTRFDIAISSATPPTIYTCDGVGDFADFMSDLLPEYKKGDSLNGGYRQLQHKASSEYDLFVINYGSGTAIQCKGGGPEWLLRKFKGQYIWMSGESGEYPLDLPFGREEPRHHVFGPHEGKMNGIHLSYLQITWWNTCKHILTPAAMVDGKLRPKGGNKTHFLVYGQGNCVGFRNEAFGKLSSIGKVHQSGKCGAPSGTDPINITRVQPGIANANWRNNLWAGHYSNYRFCLVMEHTHPHLFPYYMTEKIMLAFAAGCVPIYYGPEDLIFDIFNKKAFVYYNVTDPLYALRWIAELESNKALYNQMMSEPILAHGNETIEKYFSFTDDIGNGWYKNQVKNKLNIPL